MQDRRMSQRLDPCGLKPHISRGRSPAVRKGPNPCPKCCFLPRSRPSPFPDIDPVAVQIGPLAIRWYGLAWIGRILFAGGGGGDAKLPRRGDAQNERPCEPGASGPRLQGRRYRRLPDLAAIRHALLGGPRVGYCSFSTISAAPLRANPPARSPFAIWQGRHVLPWRLSYGDHRQR